MTSRQVDRPRFEFLSVGNYRALRQIELKKLTPLTVFLGPNGTGKSTIFDVFAFLAESFGLGLRKAWDKRGRFKELRTRGAAQARRASEMRGIKEFMAEGALLGQLYMEGHFEVDDPHSNAGAEGHPSAVRKSNARSAIHIDLLAEETSVEAI